MDFFTFITDPADLRILVAAVLGSLIGLEREFNRKDPSLRTFMLVSVGSCIFSIISVRSATVPNADPGRIAAQVVVGIGFLGAGAIFRMRERVNGLTTAALLWVTAAIGMAAGYNQIGLAFSATITVLLMMALLGLVHRMIRYFTPE